MPDPLLYVEALGVALGVSALLVVLIAWPARTASIPRGSTACLLAISGGMIVGCAVLRLHPAWPPLNGLDRLLTLILPAAVGIELLCGLQRLPRRFAWLLRLSLAAVSARVLLHGSVYLQDPGGWTAWQAGAVLIGSGVLLGAVWALLGVLQRRSPGISLPLALALAIQSAGLAVMLAGYLKGGSAAFPLAAALIGAVMMAGVMTKPASLMPAVGIGVVGLWGLLFIGVFFGRLTTAQAFTLLLAPPLCWVTELTRLRRQPRWVVGLLRLLLVAIPLAVVLLLAKLEFDRHTAPLLRSGVRQFQQHVGVTRKIERTPAG